MKKKCPKCPIVLAAFGTTTRALDTYEYLNERIKSRFPQHPIHWSYSSRMVRQRLKEKKNIDLRHPYEVLEELREQGEDWAVMQSVHLVAGHEFYRLVDEAQVDGIRTSMGLPILSSQDDYQRMASALAEIVERREEDEAIVFVGHGTDHPIWSSYYALRQILTSRFGQRVFVGCVEDILEAEEVVKQVQVAGFRRVCLVPLMLVAGVHFQEDLVGDEEDSWKMQFQGVGVEVSAVSRGIGMLPMIGDLIADHIEDAMEAVL